jgi:hypothetical protein
MPPTRWIDRTLTAAALIAGVVVAWSALAQSPGNFSTLSSTGTATLNGDVLMCSGRPWIDVRCPSMAGGAVGDDSHDDTGAIQATINAGIAGNWPVHIPAGKYKVTSLLTADYASQAANGFRLISEGAILDGRAIGSGPVLQVLCSGGSVGSPTGCFYLKIEGTLDILANSGQQNLATLTAGYSTGATVLGVSTTAPFTVGGTVILALHGGGSFAAPIDAINPGVSITLHTGLPSAADINGQVSRPSYPFMLGTYNFADAHNSAKIDHLLVNNASAAAGAGGCQFNYVLDSDIWAVCVSGGGAAGLALEETQFSRISGAGTAQGTGGAGLVLENGYNFSNTFLGLDLEVSPTCLSITFPHDGQNTFISPYFNCVTAVAATASTRNVLINPNYGGAVVNRGPQSSSIQVIGTGNRVPWQFPAVATFTAAGVDSGTAISSYNAPGASMAITLPAPAGVETGWWMGFASDNGKGMTLTPPSGFILSGGRQLSTLTLGAGNYEYVELVNDGSNYRVRTSTRSTRLGNGMEPGNWPGNWLFPSSAGYSATLADNGNVLSSYNTGAGLTVTLPPTTTLSSGWSMGFTAENTKSLAVQVNGTSGGHLIYPNSGTPVTSLSLAGNNYEFIMLQYDGSGNFRIQQATPGTATQLGMAGIGGISRWSFPSVSTYNAALADNGNAISAYNSPLGYLTVTLPSTTAISAGWTTAIANDNGKLAAVQVNPTSGGKILYPGGGASITSLTLAAGNYEFAALQFDGSNFRVAQVTPLTAQALAIPGSAGATTRWSFPSVNTYTATAADDGNALSSFNAPGAGLAVTLPAIGTLSPGWTIGVATDNSKTMSIAVNGGAGEKILVPGTLGAKASLALSTNTSAYELVILQFDGSNFRVIYATPLTANANGMAMLIGTPASSSAACQTGALQFDSNYLYACIAPNTWKRSVWSSF